MTPRRRLTSEDWRDIANGRDVPPPPVTTPGVTSVRLSETERLRAALAPFVRAWRAAEARGAGADLMAFEPVRLVDLRNAAWAAQEDGDGE